MTHFKLKSIKVFLAVFWLLFVNALFFWERFSHSSFVSRLLERLHSL